MHNRVRKQWRIEVLPESFGVESAEKILANGLALEIHITTATSSGLITVGKKIKRTVVGGLLTKITKVFGIFIICDILTLSVDKRAFKNIEK